MWYRLGPLEGKGLPGNGLAFAARELHLEHLFHVLLLFPGTTFFPGCARSFSFSHSIYFYCDIFPLFPFFIGPVQLFV